MNIPEAHRSQNVAREQSGPPGARKKGGSPVPAIIFLFILFALIGLGLWFYIDGLKNKHSKNEEKDRLQKEEQLRKVTEEQDRLKKDRQEEELLAKKKADEAKRLAEENSRKMTDEAKRLVDEEAQKKAEVEKIRKENESKIEEVKKGHDVRLKEKIDKYIK